MKIKNKLNNKLKEYIKSRSDMLPDKMKQIVLDADAENKEAESEVIEVGGEVKN